MLDRLKDDQQAFFYEILVRVLTQGIEIDGAVSMKRDGISLAGKRLLTLDGPEAIRSRSDDHQDRSGRS